MIPPLLERFCTSKRIIVVVVYFSMLLDNILLTVVVPIIPDYLYTFEQQDNIATQPLDVGKKVDNGKADTSTSVLPQCIENNILDTTSTQQTISDNRHGGEGKRSWNWDLSPEDYAQLNEEDRFLESLQKGEANSKTSHEIKREFEKEGLGSKSKLHKMLQGVGEMSRQTQAGRNITFQRLNDKLIRQQNNTITEMSGREIPPPVNCSISRQQDVVSPPTGVIFTPHGVIEENGRVGLLLSSKALVQLVMNPVVGAVTAHMGYHLPLFVGSVNLLVAALLFAFGERFMALLLARSLHGVASACISVSGMCLVAEQFPDDIMRSKVMGIILGSMALGVLLGYPFGSLLYDFVGKMAPFLIISAAVFLNGVLQLFCLDLKPVTDRILISTSWQRLLSDSHVVLIAGAIWLSTSTMAILEPCMPIWLMDNIKPQKWQLGMVFIPDSVGYLLGTNFFGSVAYHLGRWRVAVSAMMLVGLSSVLVPSAGSVSQLAVPHFGLGLGIGVVDAALVPLLASLMDSRHSAHYGSVYALQQMAVSLAYSLGPLIGGEMVPAVGFPWLMRSVGLLNLLYCPMLVFTSHDVGNPITTLNNSLMADAPAVNYKTSAASDQTPNNKNLYRRFLNSEDSD
ncbi:synaptic vesicular amine transporter-like [Periplaneta americana]|uniref:synaptic vesicular amine transporter-like n=1 Tax=Periplaneta americana TaxID=6978 RepID=UPI0037E77C49